MKHDRDAQLEGGFRGSVLALDLGTKTGFAVRSNGAIVSGTQNFSPTRFDSSAMRYIRFRRFLAELDAADPVAQIGYEEVRNHAAVGAAHVYGGFMSTLQVFAEERGIPLEAHPVGAIKKFWTGSGSAPKGKMIAVAKAQGFNPKDDNEADALAILHLMLAQGVLA